MKLAIEESFPIVEINRLAVPERNAFKPIYTMHKWFARRSSSVFRAILLGALKPAGTDIMKEFYKDHTNDPDTKGKVVLDPFMGGGTTVVEALRLGCKVIGVDLNPVAWFIVKTEVEPVDLDELKAAFDRLAKRTVDWSGKPLKETLLSLYKTECPSCGNKDADIIYTFWVKSAPCTTGTCNHYTPLFADYIIAQKKPSIRYFPECECPKCKKTFDWEREPASLVGNLKLMVNSPKFSAGEGRTSARWAYSSGDSVVCPWCEQSVKPTPPSSKPRRKKVDLSVLYCPHCEEVWQYRGELEDNVECPSCHHSYNPNEGNIPEKGKFICRGTCNGNVDAIITAIRTLPEDKLLPTQPYGIEGYCSKCAGEKKSGQTNDLFHDTSDEDQEIEVETDSNSLLSKNNGKFFKRVSAIDAALYKKAEELWENNKESLPYPKSEIPLGEKTKSGLLAHHYHSWHQLFNSRQLLELSTLLKEIERESDARLRELLILTFSHTLEANNVFTRTLGRRNTPGGIAPGGIFSRHDFQPKLTFSEQNVFGTASGRKTFQNCWAKVIEGKEFNWAPFDRKILDGKQINVTSQEVIIPNDSNISLFAQSSTRLPFDESVDVVITDPPYAGNVNYAELAEFFYVWLRLALKDSYPQFMPESPPKAEEAIVNRTRGKSAADFSETLLGVFKESGRISHQDARLIFTFHHSEDSAWEALLNAVCEAGYYVEAVYPVHGEAENSLHLMENEAISYDLIHVCRKRESGAESSRKSWATVRQDIRRRARDELKLIESGRYGNEPLSSMDVGLLLIGKCLEVYSKHYGTIVDHEDKPVPIKRALEEIKLLIDQLVTKGQPMPAELEDLMVEDKVSYVYFTALCGYKEITADELSKGTRGIIETSVLKDCGLVIKGRQNRGRSFEVKLPVERVNELKSKFHDNISLQSELFNSEPSAALLPGTNFVDYVHYLIALAELGENVRPWLEKFSGMRPQIRAALDYLLNHPKVSFKESVKKVLGLMDERTLFTKQG